MTIKLYNTKTRKKEVFAPLDPMNVRMYVCGPTVYDRAHIGNARPVIVFDVLYRLLRHTYGVDHVAYARNFTDVDDKINARAAESGRSIREITDETIGWYLEDMKALGNLEPDQAPRATEYIAEMVEMIEELIDSGHAYEAEGHVLFDVTSYEKYGSLSGRSIDDMIAGSRVEIAPYKRNPMDFVLWKPSGPALPGWDSPWGRGRPGWHIECSAMTKALFGDQFDIHGGGLDLAFPHHENEKAQSCCTAGEDSFAQVWMHNEMLQVEGKKMSKSLGNFFTVRDLISEYDKKFAIENIGPAIRLRLLESHYRSTADAGRSYIEAAATKLGLWWFWTNDHLRQRPSEREQKEILEGSAFLGAILNDLNIPLAISEIDSLVSAIRRVPANHSILNDLIEEKEKLATQIFTFVEFLGFKFDDLQKLHGSSWSKRLKQRSGAASQIAELLASRDMARAEKNFGRADQIRDMLIDAGVVIKDTPNGITWELSPGFDSAKLEALK
ncbi:MAG: cysteine--tRNA ligase [Proteobacteria bacterium]|nr:cysteine--tRNA ligase [Pseudomonadota bacterium]